MKTFDEFKAFVKDKPFLKDKVKNKETTWQELFEHYDLYGENDDLFKETSKINEDNLKTEDSSKNETNTSKKEDTKDNTNSFLNMLSGIDVDKISDGLNGMKKILSILGEVTAGDEVTSFSSRRAQRPYKRDDD